MATKEEIREMLPRLLREDSAFREEVFSILTGNFATKDDIARILEEIRRLREESDRRFEAFERRFESFERRFESFERRMDEHSKRIEEHSKRIEEHSKRIEEHSKTIEAHSKTIEEHSKTIAEHSRTIAEHSKTIAEHSKKIEDLIAVVNALSVRVDRGFERFGRKLDAMGTRFGLLAEVSFRTAIHHILAKHFGAEARRWVERDAAGAVFGSPANVELDVVVKDGAPLLIEIKESASRADVALLKRKAAFYEERTGQKPQSLYVLAAHFEPGTENTAEVLGVVRLSDSELD